MTIADKQRIEVLRGQGYGYKKIAGMLNISPNTVKAHCKRNNIVPASGDANHCRFCGSSINQTPGKKPKIFCSDACRNKWWNSHLELVNRKAIYEYVCPCCGEPFKAYGNAHRKYCSHECYIRDRFGGGENE